MPVDNMSVLCGKCRSALKEDPHVQPDQRIPCPSCGSTARIFQVTIHDSLIMKGKLGMKAKHSSGGKPLIEEVTGDALDTVSNWNDPSLPTFREHLYITLVHSV